MRKTLTILTIIFILFSFVGCNRIIGGTIFELFGMKFTSQIEMMSECLDVDLTNHTDSDIKTIYSSTDPVGNDLTIEYIDFVDTGDLFENNIENKEKWNSLPFNATVETLFKSSGATEHFAFDNIREGYFILSGVSLDKNEFDFDLNNFNSWYSFHIGVWDSNTETLYYISITSQPQ